MIKIFMISAIFFQSCTMFKENSFERKLQTDILSSISAENQKFSQCAKSSDIFSHFKNTRIRSVIYLSINKTGNVEKFKLDDKNYPPSFSECIFSIVDLVNFPRNQKHDLIEVEQPFIFSKK